MRDFESFFERATGHRPYGYQARIARDGLPDLVQVPTGAGKTGVILACGWGTMGLPTRSRCTWCSVALATTLIVDLDQFRPGVDRSWTKTVLGLVDRYGPFTLAYLETVVRVADWRASGGRELPEP